ALPKQKSSQGDSGHNKSCTSLKNTTRGCILRVKIDFPKIFQSVTKQINKQIITTTPGVRGLLHRVAMIYHLKWPVFNQKL
ncbi:hypothetical protein NG726_38695, partial [Pseudomonas sp. MOB-449]|nr:hypothetical protein [Pseudomonas sp. MOB-449]